MGAVAWQATAWLTLPRTAPGMKPWPWLPITTRKNSDCLARGNNFLSDQSLDHFDTHVLRAALLQILSEPFQPRFCQAPRFTGLAALRQHMQQGDAACVAHRDFPHVTLGRFRVDKPVATRILRNMALGSFLFLC
jgi:hypothetical protein